MKILLLVVLSLGFGVANAKQSVDFERSTASSKSANNLSAAFQEAISGSDEDLKSTKSSVLLEENARLAKWSSGKRKKEIIIQGTAAVDPMNINSKPKKIVRESQNETDKIN